MQVHFHHLETLMALIGFTRCTPFLGKFSLKACYLSALATFGVTQRSKLFICSKRRVCSCASICSALNSAMINLLDI